MTSDSPTIQSLIAKRHSDMRKAGHGADIVLLNDSENFTAYNRDAHKAWSCVRQLHAKGQFGTSKLKNLAEEVYEWSVPLSEVYKLLTHMRESYSIALVERITRPAGTFGPPFACVWVVERVGEIDEEDCV